MYMMKELKVNQETVKHLEISSCSKLLPPQARGIMGRRGIVGPVAQWYLQKLELSWGAHARTGARLLLH